MRHTNLYRRDGTANIWKPVYNLQEFRTVMAQNAATTVSSRYSFIPTGRVVDVIQQHDWHPVSCSEARVRDLARQGFQKHAIRFRHGAQGALRIGETVPELLLVNSHAGTAAFWLSFGLFEVLCSNGNAVELHSAERKIRHIGYTDQAVSDAVSGIMPAIPTVMSQVETWKQIRLEPQEQEALAMSAIELKWDGEKFKVQPDDLLVVHHRGQEEPTLWNIHNRIQENLIRGGAKVQNLQSQSREGRRARAVTGLNEDLRLNRALWTLTSRLAELKD